MPKKSNNTPSDSSKKFLEFNGHEMYFLLIGDTWWIALKPICEALEVDWNSLHETLLKDPVLSKARALKKMIAADNKLRLMVSLPEFYFYGWMFQINSNSEQLIKFKKECYEVLANKLNNNKLKI